MREIAGRMFARLQQHKAFDFLYIVWLCWGAGLLLYVMGSPSFILPVVPMLLILSLGLMEIVLMFGKKNGVKPASSTAVTVIAAGACFKGELKVVGDLEVHGHLNGSIQLTDGVLRVMQGGRIEGDVDASCVFINGLLEGSCSCSEMEILESGQMYGIFKGGSLSICKGGNFVGQSQARLTNKIEPELQTEFESRALNNWENMKELPQLVKDMAREEQTK